jgi:ribosomal protein S24E
MMELRIENEKENKLFNREEISGMIVFKGATPSNQEVIAHIAKKKGCGEELVAIKGIYTKFGTQTAGFEAFIYKTKEELISTEPKKKEKKQEE